MKKRTTEKLEDIKIERSCGNVFRDLGLKHADKLLVRADLMIEIRREIEARGLTQTQAAALIGLTQSDISNIARSEYSRFSQERLMEALRRLGLEVEINIRRTKNGYATIRVHRHAEPKARAR